MTNKKFDEFIASQLSDAKKSNIDWNKKLVEWKEHLSDFYQDIADFIRPYREGKKIEYDFTKKKIYESYIGEYEVDSYIIKIGENVIRFDPIGTNLIGAYGRVDMIGPNGKVIFVLVDKKASEPKIIMRMLTEEDKEPPGGKEKDEIELAWKIATSPPKIKYSALQQDSFFDALMEVTNG